MFSAQKGHGNGHSSPGHLGQTPPQALIWWGERTREPLLPSHPLREKHKFAKRTQIGKFATCSLSIINENLQRHYVTQNGPILTLTQNCNYPPNESNQKQTKNKPIPTKKLIGEIARRPNEWARASPTKIKPIKPIKPRNQAEKLYSPVSR